MRTIRVAIIVSFLATVLAMQGSSPVSAQKQNYETTTADWVGAKISHPKDWYVERERVTYDETFGFTLWDSPPGISADNPDGGVPKLRVSRAYDLTPADIPSAVDRRIREYPDLPVKKRTFKIGQQDIKAVSLWPIPGSIVSTELYLAKEGRVYLINIYDKSTKSDIKKTLSALRLYEPTRSVGSLDLDDATGNTQDSSPSGALDTGDQASSEETTLSGMSTTGERRISEGCWRADRRYFIQTQHDSYANSRRGDGLPKGWSMIGRPNYWGQYTHGDLGYGRCNSRYYTNDKFAIDYPFNKGDRIYSPFRKGTVTFKGSNRTHKNYGKMVVVRAANGKYVSLSAHLNHIPDSIKKGKTVYKNTVIGRAGNTGDPSIPVGEVHLHQAFYRYPSYNSDGSPYGGASLRADRLRYSGTAAKRKGFNVSSGKYRLGRVKPDYRRFCKERVTCGEGYRIGN